MEETNYTSFWQQKNTSWKGFIHLEHLNKKSEIFHPPSSTYVWWNPFTWYNTDDENTSKN